MEANKDVFEAIKLENLTWSQEEFTLSDFLDKFPLPQIVKVQEGYYGPDEDSCLAADQILFLHALKHTEKVQARDVRKRELHIPLNCSQKIEVRPSNLKDAFESVADLAKVFSSKKIPQFVRVTQGYSSDDDTICLNPGDKLKLIKVVSGHKEDCLEVEHCNDASGFSMKLPLSATARLQPLTDGHEYYVKEAVGLKPMPFFFQFVNPFNLSDTGEATVFNSTLGVLRAEKTYHDSTVMCTTKEGSTRTVVTCPKKMQITVTAASGALIGDKEYMKVCKFFHDGVSLKRIENMECFNVFASRDTIREYQYEEPESPNSLMETFSSDNNSESESDENGFTHVDMSHVHVFKKFDYEQFRSSFDGDGNSDKANNDDEKDEYEDMTDPSSSAAPNLNNQKSPPPPTKEKPKRPMIKARGVHPVKPNPEIAQVTPTPPQRHQVESTSEAQAPTCEDTTIVTSFKENIEDDSTRFQDDHTTLPPNEAALASSSLLSNQAKLNQVTSNQETQETANQKEQSHVPSNPPNQAATHEIEQMTIGEVSEFLKKHHLAEFVETFEYNEVDGEMLAEMDLEMMEALGMNKFQQRKLSKLVQGWRPKC